MQSTELPQNVPLGESDGRFEDWISLRDRLIAEAPQEFEAFDLERDPSPPIDRGAL